MGLLTTRNPGGYDKPWVVGSTPTSAGTDGDPEQGDDGFDTRRNSSNTNDHIYNDITNNNNINNLNYYSKNRLYSDIYNDCDESPDNKKYRRSIFQWFFLLPQLLIARQRIRGNSRCSLFMSLLLCLILTFILGGILILLPIPKNYHDNNKNNNNTNNSSSITKGIIEKNINNDIINNNDSYEYNDHRNMNINVVHQQDNHHNLSSPPLPYPTDGDHHPNHLVDDDTKIANSHEQESIQRNDYDNNSNNDGNNYNHHYNNNDYDSSNKSLKIPIMKKRVQDAHKKVSTITPTLGNVKGLPATLLTSSIEDIMDGASFDKMHGVVGVGPDGAPLWTPKEMKELTPEEKEEAHTGYCFNSAVSDSLSLDRSLPDFRIPEYCENQRKQRFDELNFYNEDTDDELYYYDDDEDTNINTTEIRSEPVSESLHIHDSSLGGIYSSVVIVFHNELLSVLLRSIHSVLNRTPPNLLKEIIVVDDNSDASTHPWLFSQLNEYVAKGLPKVKILRLLQRRGLMGARSAGASISTSPIIVFLDSHVECMKGWMEPLLLHVRDDWRSAAMPVIGGIDFDTFEISESGIETLGFNWNMGHHHMHDKFMMREENKNKERGLPISSPIMPGGIFAISKKWWQYLRGYDEDMRLYGGEEFELSFKIWMAGGSLVVLPCSRVAHVFRQDTYWKGQVYVVPGHEVIRNKRRTALVWMDDYARLVDMVMSPLPPDVSLGDISKQKELRKEIGIYDFNWYIKNIFPEIFVPDLSNSLMGAIANVAINGCLDTLTKAYTQIGAYPCHYGNGTQAFFLDGTTGNMLVAIRSFNGCVGGDPKRRILVEKLCRKIPRKKNNVEKDIENDKHINNVDNADGDYNNNNNDDNDNESHDNDIDNISNHGNDDDTSADGRHDDDFKDINNSNGGSDVNGNSNNYINTNNYHYIGDDTKGHEYNDDDSDYDEHDSDDKHTNSDENNTDDVKIDELLFKWKYDFNTKLLHLVNSEKINNNGNKNTVTDNVNNIDNNNDDNNNNINTDDINDSTSHDNETPPQPSPPLCIRFINSSDPISPFAAALAPCDPTDKQQQMVFK